MARLEVGLDHLADGAGLLRRNDLHHEAGMEMTEIADRAMGADGGLCDEAIEQFQQVRLHHAAAFRPPTMGMREPVSQVRSSAGISAVFAPSFASRIFA